jgi:hypothetical protein
VLSHRLKPPGSHRAAPSIAGPHLGRADARLAWWLATALLAACAGAGPAVQPPNTETPPTGQQPAVTDAPAANDASAEPQPGPQRDQEDVARYAKPHVPDISPFPGTAGLSAASCGACHTEIAAEWAASTHSKAWVDPQFQAELTKDPDVGWICLNCHTPLVAQQPELVVYEGSVRGAARAPNPAFNEALRDEGITCLTCHWRSDGIAAVHQDVKAPHPTVYAPELRESGTCTVCHEAQARIEDALVCAFSTGTEWDEATPGKTCPECHMPKVTRASAPGAPERIGGQHHWPGSLLPKVPWTQAQAELFSDWAPGSDAQLTVQPTAAPGAPVTATLTMVNARAGHRLPTGDPERHYVMTLVAEADGVTLGTSEATIGQVWEWWPKAKKQGDTRPAPGESRDVSLLFTMPKSVVTLKATIEHVRISDENAAYHHLKDYPTRREVHTMDGRVEPREAAP